jgi:foldase protein PrsA
MLAQRHLRALSALTIALCACLALAACGSTSHPSKQAHAGVTQKSAKAAQVSATEANLNDPRTVLLPRGASASQVIASVGEEKITAAQVAHIMQVKNARTGAPLPDPPRYSACIANLKATTAEAPAGTPPQSEAQLEHTCVGQYEEQLGAALSFAIHGHWLLGEAAEEGIKASEGEVLKELEASKKALGGGEKFEAYLKSSGQSLAELKSEIRLNILSDGIFAIIAKKNHAAAGAEVARYYAEHAQQYSVPQGRDVRILRTATEPSVLRAKEQIESGQSFASVAGAIPAIAQPLGAKHGEVKDLTPGFYEEKELNDAIFSAPLNRLLGPIKLTARHRTIAPETNSGFFLFEVKRIVPERRIPLAKVEATIATQLTQQQKQQNLASFIRAFKRKWTARTDCRPGFVIVRYCKQFKPTKASEAEDAYEL